MRASFTVLAAIAAVLVVMPASASAQESHPATIGIEPAGPVETAGGATAEFSVLLRKHAQGPIKVALLVEKRGLTATVEGCPDQAEEYAPCFLDIEESATIKMTVRAPDGTPEYDEYHSVHVWVYEVETGGRVEEDPDSVAVATVLVSGVSPFAAPAPPPDDRGFVPVVRGRVVDSVTGDPVRNACVQLETAGFGYPGQACTGDDGRFRFIQHGGGPIAAGKLSIEANALGYQDYAEQIDGVADHATDLTVRLVPETPPAAPDDSGPPVVPLLWVAAGFGLVLVLVGLVLLVVRGRSARP